MDLKIILHKNVVRLLFMACFIMLCVSINAQNITVNCNKEPLKEVLTKLSNQSKYKFVFSNEIKAMDIKISVSYSNKPIEMVMKEIFTPNGILYTIKGNQVILTKSSQQKIISPKQNSPIKGLVKDENGEPIIGATIQNTSRKNLYAYSDLDGNFNIDAYEGDILVISSIGMQNYSFTASSSKKEYNVILSTDVIALDNVVVTGYQTLSRDRVTGAFGSVTSDKLNTTMTSDVISKIDGKVAGLKVSNGNIIIRGAGTLLSSTDPLIVVDGFPIENGLESVNPDDIQNITVLKDAAAASIWGTRAGNGVIVITTKQGKKNNKPTIDVSYQFTISNKNKISDLHLLSASDAVDLDLELLQKDFWSPETVDWHYSVGKLHEYYYDALLATDFEASFDDIMKDGDFSKKIDKLRKSQAHKQLEKYIFQNPMQHRANISLSGGSERSDYYVSGVFESNKVNSIRNINNDFKLNLKYSYYITDKLTLNTNASIFYSLSEQNSADNYSLSESYSYHDLVDENGKRIQYYMIDPWEGRYRESLGYLPYTENLLDTIDENDNKSNNFTARIQAALNYKIIDGLNINTKFQYERGFLKSETSERVSHPGMRAVINAYTTVKDDGQLQYNFPLGGQYSVDNQNSEAWTWRNQIDYNKEFGGKHQLLVLLGHELRKYKTTSNSSNQYGYDFQSQTYVPLNEALLVSGEYLTWMDSARYTFDAQNSYSEVDNRDFSLYANAGYTFNKKYSLSLSGRMDQSNIFGNDSKYKYNIIWSGGLSWKLSDEKFMDCDWLDNLVLRATYGLGGNINKSFFPVLMGKKYVDYYSGLPYLNLTNPENKNLKWETSKTTNIGVDFSFINGRIDGSIDLYNKRGDDLLGRVSLDPTNGFKSATMNFASVKNSGFELSLSTMPIQTNNFSWAIGGNITYNKNKVIKVDDEGGSDTDLIKQIPNGII